jgi:hypothetical protein
MVLVSLYLAKQVQNLELAVPLFGDDGFDFGQDG